MTVDTPRCEHPSCPATPDPGCRLCRAHGAPAWPPCAHWSQPAVPGHAPTLDSEIARLAALRDRVERWLEQMMVHGTADPAEVRRTLLALSHLGRSLAAMLEKNEAGGASEMERLFADAARKVRERAAQERDV